MSRGSSYHPQRDAVIQIAEVLQRGGDCVSPSSRTLLTAPPVPVFTAPPVPVLTAPPVPVFTAPPVPVFTAPPVPVFTAPPVPGPAESGLPLLNRLASV